MATTTDQITPRKVRELWDRGMRATRTERQQAALNHWFLRNRMWVYYNQGSQRLEEVQRVPGRVRASVARVGPDSRRIIAKLMRRAITFDVPPSSPDDAAIHASRVAEAALVEAQQTQSWEALRTDHAWQVWEAGVAAVVDEWDWTVGTPVAMDEQGRTIGTGEVKLTVASVHEIACEPGTRDLERALWWVWGLALPPPEVQETFGLEREPKPDARAVDTMRNLGTEETGYEVPLTMVLTYFGRPANGQPGMVLRVVNDTVVEQTEWPFPYTDRLNICVAKCQPVHGKWYGHTPLSDAVSVQALYNASWSSIVEHMKLAGVARLWCPMGSVDDIEELTDTPGEAVEYNAINGARPQYEAPPVMPDWWIRQPDMLAKAMDDILGVHDVSRGEAPSGIESGVALSILAENDDTPVGALAKEMGECWGRVASHVLKLWEANVRETRQSMVHLPGNVPEVIRWTGGDLLGQTTAKVPMDSVMPRSRAAQAAYALQLYDRKIIQTPSELAKVADLPDQDDLLAGIDPDTARAQRENYWLTVGFARTVDVTDDHANHIKVHRDFMRSERYDYLGDQTRELFKMHMQAHEQYAAGQGATQATAASMSPMAAALPTEATKPISPEDIEAYAPMSAAAPSATDVITGPEAQPPPEPGGVPSAPPGPPPGPPPAAGPPPQGPMP